MLTRHFCGGSVFKGVFINPALVEPFGLTLIEVSVHTCFATYKWLKTNKYLNFVKPHSFLQAAAYGLPIVATKNGGPVDILKVILNLYILKTSKQEFQGF